MKSTNMVRVEHNPGDPPIEAMPDDELERELGLTEEEIQAAMLAEIESPPIPCGTDEELAKIGLVRIPNPYKMRQRLNLTQEQFAAAYRIPIGTLRDWEQGRKIPDATARAYLQVIERDPETVARLLQPAA
jgi:putative transcriptional regulator